MWRVLPLLSLTNIILLQMLSQFATFQHRCVRVTWSLPLVKYKKSYIGSMYRSFGRQCCHVDHFATPQYMHKSYSIDWQKPSESNSGIHCDELFHKNFSTQVAVERNSMKIVGRIFYNISNLSTTQTGQKGASHQRHRPEAHQRPAWESKLHILDC